MLLELLDVANELRAAPRRMKRAIAETALELGFDVLPEIHANVRKGPKGWEVVAAALDPELLPEPGDDCVRASARLDFSRAEVPPVQPKDP